MAREALGLFGTKGELESNTLAALKALCKGALLKQSAKTKHDLIQRLRFPKVGDLARGVAFTRQAQGKKGDFLCTEVWVAPNGQSYAWWKRHNTLCPVKGASVVPVAAESSGGRKRKRKQPRGSAPASSSGRATKKRKEEEKGGAAPKKREKKMPKHAIVVGLDYSGNLELKNAANDARAVRAKLELMGYTVKMAQARRPDGLGNFLQNWKVPKRSQLVFFFAGHGKTVAGTANIVCADKGTFTVERVRTPFVLTVWLVCQNSYSSSPPPPAQIQNSLQAKDPVFSAIILDCCRVRRKRGPASGAGRLPAVYCKKNMSILLACEPGKTADDNEDEDNGLFTKHLLKHLAKQQDITKVVRATCNGVVDESKGQQRPWYSESLVEPTYRL
jgi:hypothetical protein